MKKKVFMLLNLSIFLLAGCGTEEVSSEAGIEATSVTNVGTEGNSSEAEDESLEEQDALENEKNIYWSSLEQDWIDTKEKVLVENDTFVEDFISGYESKVESETELINCYGRKMTDYHLANGNDIYAFEEKRENGILATVAYVDWSKAVEYEEEALSMDGYFPVEGDTGYDWENMDTEDGLMISYVDNQDYFTDAGTKCYDKEGRLLIWEHYLTSGCKTTYFVWNENGISMMIDIGGMTYSADPDNEDISIGEVVYLYQFKESVALEDITIGQ